MLMSELNYTSQTGSNDFSFSGDGSSSTPLNGYVYSYGGSQVVVYTAGASGTLSFNFSLYDMMSAGASGYIQLNASYLGGGVLITPGSSYSGSVSISSGDTLTMYFNPGSDTSHMSNLTVTSLYITTTTTTTTTTPEPTTTTTTTTTTAAPITQYYSVASGGITVSGESIFKCKFSYVASGSLTISSSAIVLLRRLFVSSGSITIGSSAISKIKIIYIFTGNIVSSGTSNSNIIKYRYRPSGTTTLSGSFNAVLIFRYVPIHNLIWRETQLPTSGQWRSIAYGNNTFATPSYGSSIVALSPDGVSWTQQSLPESRDWYAITSIEKDLIVWEESINGGLSNLPESPQALFSNLSAGFSTISGFMPIADVEYVSFVVPVNCELVAIDLISYVSQRKFAFFGIDSGSTWTAGTNTVLMLGDYYFSNDDLNKNLLDLSGAGILSSGNYVIKLEQTGSYTSYKIRFEVVPIVGYDKTTFVAIAKNTDKVATSVDGVTWLEQTLPISADWECITYGYETFIAVAYNSNVAVKSTDSVTWTQITLPYSYEYKSIAYGSSRFVLIAQNVNVALVSDYSGSNWIPVPLPVAGTSWQSVTYGGGLFLAVSSNGFVGATSIDGITWTQVTLPVTTINLWKSVVYGKGKYVVSSTYSEEVLSSNNTVNWTKGYLPPSAIPLSLSFPSSAYGNDTFVVVHNGSNIASVSQDGDLVLSSLSIYAIENNVTATGGLSLGGLSKSSFIITCFGGCNIGGSAIITMNIIISIVSSGGCKISGLSVNNSYFLTTGGVSLIGDSEVYKKSDIAMIGGASLGGEAKFSTIKTVFGSNGLSLSGVSETYQIYSPITTGGISLSGNHRINIYYYPYGEQIFLSGNFNSRYTNNFDLKITYQVYKEFTADLVIDYNVGDMPYSWYRVEGCCRLTNSTVDCDVVPLQTNDPKCSGALDKQKYIQNVLARSVKELCSILSASSWEWTVCSIGKFTRPPDSIFLNQDGNKDQCNTIDEQLGFCEIPECLKLCVNTRGIERFAYSFTGSQKFKKQHVSSGRIIFYGSFLALEIIPPQIVQGSGTINVSETVGFEYRAFNETVEGLISVVGDSDVSCSYFEFSSDGQITIDGNLNVRSNFYNYEVVLGTIVIGGESHARLKFFVLLDLENNFVLINGSAEYPFFYYPSGLGFSGKGIELFNIAGTSRLSRLNQISDGTIIVNGNSKFISPNYHYESVGSMTIAGTSLNKRNSYLYLPDDSGMTISSQADTVLLDVGNFHYTSDGTIDFYSSIDSYIAIYRYTSEDTDIFVSGDSDTGGSWKGVVEELFGYGMTSSQLFNPNPIENTTGISNSDNAIVAFTDCANCGSVASFLYLRSNLFESTYLKNMLTLNNFKIPEEFALYYSARLKSWVGTVHYKGVDNKNTNSPVDISINFEFSCVNSLGDEELGSNYLKFNVMIRVKDINTKKENKTKVLVLFPAEKTCYYVNSNDFDMNFSVSTKGKYVVVPFDVLVDYLIVSDDLGLFVNSYWNTNLFEVSISDSNKVPPLSRYPFSIVENP